MSRVLLLELSHLLVDFLGRDLATEDSRSSQVLAATRIASSHHVASVEHLRDELTDRGVGEALLGASGQRSVANQEEVETREGDQVNSQLAEIGVELTREAERSSDARHDLRDEMVKVDV